MSVASLNPARWAPSELVLLNIGRFHRSLLSILFWPPAWPGTDRTVLTSPVFPAAEGTLSSISFVKDVMVSLSYSLRAPS